jgi:hypothetical protein
LWDIPVNGFAISYLIESVDVERLELFRFICLCIIGCRYGHRLRVNGELFDRSTNYAKLHQHTNKDGARKRTIASATARMSPLWTQARLA